MSFLAVYHFYCIFDVVWAAVQSICLRSSRETFNEVLKFAVSSHHELYDVFQAQVIFCHNCPVFPMMITTN